MRKSNNKPQAASHKPQVDPPFIKLADVSHSYPESDSAHVVLKNTCLDIAHGEKLALLGRSGSGKSTLLNLIAGIDLPDSGSISFTDQDIVTIDETSRTLLRRRQVGFIYQFFNLVPSLTALENVAFTLELNGIRGEQAREQSLAMLQRLGMDHKHNCFPSRLSGGEQQRVAIARALVHDPAIVLADEPTGNLDAKTGADVLTVLHEVLDASGSSLLLVTHSLAVARTTDRVLTLEEGLISERDGDFTW